MNHGAHAVSAAGAGGPDISDLTLGRFALVVELLRPWALFGIYLWLAAWGYWLLALPVAAATCFAAFVQMHDAIHNALGLPKRINGAVLALSALLLLKSGHALRATHLRHHGKCLGKDDPEGAPATWPLTRVLFRGPFHILALRREALAIAPKTWRAQLVETAATALLLAGAILHYVASGSAVGLWYWAVAAGISATMPLWAAYIPHRVAEANPAVRAAARLARFFTPVLSSFAYHHVHHRFPKVPTALLPVAAGRAGHDEGCDHEH